MLQHSIFRMKVEADEVQLQKLQSEVGRAQSALVHGLSILNATPAETSGLAQLLLGSSATPFGNTPGGVACHSTHSEAYTAGTNTVKAFAGTVDSDAERLKMAITLYRLMDDQNAENLLKLNPHVLDFLSTHLSKGDKDAAEQAAQIDTLRGLVAGPPFNSVVVGGDFNAVSEDSSPSAQAIRKFAGDGFDTDAGALNDRPAGQPQGTSASYRPIDHVLPRGVGTTPAERWDRDESDHDGQRVDVTLPAW
ncbi:endonuclease/exonuclease/phosphatase family protein [Nocardia gipuzkoensis]